MPAPEPLYYVTTATTGVIFARHVDAVPVLATFLQPAQVDPEVREQGRAWLAEQGGWRPATATETTDRQYALVCAEHRESGALHAERVAATDVESATAAAHAFYAEYPADEYRRQLPIFQGIDLPRPPS